MSRIKANIAANFAGQSCQALLSIVCAPLYIKLLGIEALGLMAFYMLVQTITQILDMGLATTVNRQVAQLHGQGPVENRDLLGRVVGTLERWYWTLGSLIGLLLFFVLPHLALWWLHPEQLTREDIYESAQIFGLLAILQWPIIFYQSGLQGLQRQVVVNAIQIPFSALNSLGGVAVIWFGPRTIVALFVWQTCVTLVHVGVLGFQFWKGLEMSRSSSRVDVKVFQRFWKFSLHMGGVSLIGLVITHLDKVVLSRLLSLEIFSHYTLAATLARGMYIAVTPVFNAYFPRFSTLAGSDDTASLRLCYHSAAQIMSVLCLPLAVVLCFFSMEICSAWLRNSNIAHEVALISILLVIGNCLNGLMNIPYALQLAIGRTDISLYISIFLLSIFAPAIAVATYFFGAIGAAAVWGMANGLYVAVGVHFTHKHLLVGEGRAWLRSDVLPPLAVALSVVGLGRLLVPEDVSMIISLMLIALFWILATAFASMSVRHIRDWGWTMVKRLRAG
jgi:O-antigen/teichoic acid export membrane protein